MFECQVETGKITNREVQFNLSTVYTSSRVELILKLPILYLRYYTCTAISNNNNKQRHPGSAVNFYFIFSNNKKTKQQIPKWM